MKFSTVVKLLLAMLFVSFSSRQALSGMVPITVAFDNITKVEQRHNPGVDPNYIELIVEGKSAGKGVGASISIKNPNAGAQGIFQSCQRDAMLAFHYPDKYKFEIASENPLSDGWLKVYVGPADSDYVFCSLNAKAVSLPVPVTQSIGNVQISN
ncbi:MAG: hypothetical protein K8R69_02900 [Deltaproteobacteria bacterium]|nr:hypothetical protein [Deltaproteobacteria bacterium]